MAIRTNSTIDATFLSSINKEEIIIAPAKKSDTRMIKKAIFFDVIELLLDINDYILRYLAILDNFYYYYCT